MQTARYIEGQTGSIDPADRGLAYGDGLFETMAIRGGRIRFLDYRLERLAKGCERLRIAMPDRQELEQRVQSASGSLDHGTIKLILTRGSGPRGYSPPEQTVPTIVLFADADSVRHAPAVSVAALRTPLSENSVLAGIKHLCRLEQVLGRLELSRLEADEGLMATTTGAVIGGTSRNVFAVFGGTIRTPDLEQAGIEGIMRRAVLEAAPAAGYVPEIARLSLEALRAADEVFLTNALVGIQSVARLDDLVFDRFPAAKRLRTVLGLERAD
ncbi:MAG: aminodeoxychorismate lyase [Gammaproteobacteria bacterium]